MTQPDPNSEKWNSCPPGQLNQLADRLQATRRTRSMLRQLQVVAGAATVLLVSILIFNRLPEQQPSFGGIPCSEVLRQADGFVAGELDSAIVQTIENHLEHCAACRKRIAAMQNPNTSKFFPQRKSAGTTASRNDKSETVVIATR